MALLPDNRANIDPGRLFILLVFITSLGLFAMQVFIPTIPQVSEDFGISFAAAQLALSLSLVAIAITMLFAGPLSDRFGRRPAAIGGILLFLVGSLLCIAAWNIGSLIAGRIIQSIGGAFGLVLGRSILRDLYSSKENAKAMSYVMMASVAVPAIAPLAGAVMTMWMSWRLVFLVSLVLGLFCLWQTWFHLKETAPEIGKKAGRPVAMGERLKAVFTPAFIFLNFAAACSIAIYYSMITNAAYAVKTFMGGTEIYYGILLLSTTGFFMTGNFISANLVMRTGVRKLITFGLVASVIATAYIATLIASGIYIPLALLGGVMVFAFSNGFVVSNTQSSALNAVEPKVAGLASGILGFTQMALAGGVAQIIAVTMKSSPLPIAVAMLSCAFLSTLFFWMARRTR